MICSLTKLKIWVTGHDFILNIRSVFLVKAHVAAKLSPALHASTLDCSGGLANMRPLKTSFFIAAIFAPPKPDQNRKSGFEAALQFQPFLLSILDFSSASSSQMMGVANGSDQRKQGPGRLPRKRYSV
ncbi:hypothetical protein CKAH01_02146 [Colletotrichum kahawae]|uniref:Uncharacterized protein n=1 Tax=Colletotrichum kahawae TaxID=34407 RepID=A0AAD9Y0C8_COLKA|nr:hypothetical protein CKAH01_02146 [Colletotrichum kahawae]